MKRFYIYCILAIVAIAGCKKPDEPVGPDKPDKPTPENTVLSVKLAKTVYASDENQAGPSHTWTADDEITVNGKTSTGITINASDASVAEFAFGEPIDKPYTIAYPILAEGKFNIPASQQYKQADFDWSAAAFVGKAADAESVAELKNASAFLKLKITSNEANCSMASVAIKGNSSEKLNGAFTPNYTAGTINASGNVAESEKCITISCGSGVAVTAEGTDFYIVLPPVTFTAGYTVTMKDSAEKEVSVGISGKTVLAAGRIYTAEVEFKEQGTTPEPENTVLSVKLANAVYAADQQPGHSFEWTAGDAITVNGKTSTGITINASDASVAEFAFGEVLTAPFNIAYPVLSTGNFTLPATQQYQEDDFNWSSAVFVGSAADASSEAELKIANSFLKIKITTTETACSITSVAITGKNNEKLNGAFAPDYTNKTIIHSGTVAAAEKTVTLSSQAGVSVIGSGKDFCIVLPPVSFTNGYVITLTDSEENERSYEYEAAAFEAGKIYAKDIEYTVAGPGKEKNLSITIGAPAVAMTGAETVTPLWKQFDRLRIYPRQEDTEITGEASYTLQNQNSASANASFTMAETVTLYDRSTYTIRGFVPSEAYVFNFIPKTTYPVAQYPWSAKAVRVDAVQNPAADGVDSHSDILYIKPPLTVTPENIAAAANSNGLSLSAEFVRATAVLKIVFTDATADSECDGVKFDYIEIEAPDNIAGDAVINLDSGFTGQIYQYPSKKVRACYADGFSVGSGNAVWLNVLPGTLNGNVKIYGHSGKLDFYKVVPVNSLEAGKITKLEVSLSDNNVYFNIVGPDKGAAEDLRIMQFNVLYSSYTDASYPAAAWDTRKLGIAAMLEDTKPDIICMNECQKNNFHYIYDDSDGILTSHGLLYNDYDCYRQGTNSTDDNVIFYKKGYTKLESNHFDVDSYSPSPRHAVWVKLRSPKGKEFYVVSTHIESANGAENDAIRTQSAQTIVTNMKAIVGNNATIFVLGDMNDTLSDTKKGIEPFIGNDGRTGWLQDARLTSPVVVGNYSLNKFGKYAPTDAMNVDMIFYRNITSPEKFTTVTKAYAGVRYISDHYPVMLDCKL